MLVHRLSIVDADLRVLDQAVRAVHLRIRCARHGNLRAGAVVVRVAHEGRRRGRGARGAPAPRAELGWAVDRGLRVLISAGRRVVIADQPISAVKRVQVFPRDGPVDRPPVIGVIPRVLDQTVPAVKMCTRQGNLRAGAIGVRVAVYEASRWRGRWGGRRRRRRCWWRWGGRRRRGACDTPVRVLGCAVDRGNHVLKSGARRVVITDHPILAPRIHVHRLVVQQSCAVLVYRLSIVDAIFRVLDQT
eukprot:scaffold17412_cov54-Phaeocystis_antarctica.AAC.1